MMSKNGRPLAFFYTFLTTFIVLTLTLYSYFYAKNQHQWMMELIKTRMFKLPLLIYIIVISLFVSGIVMGVLYIYNRRIYNRIEDKLQLLATGNYEHEILMVKETDSEDLETELDHDIITIKNSLLSMSKELQALNSSPKMVEGESKEEVIKEERQRLARELHDSVSQQLFAATMMLSALNEGVSDLDVPEVVEKQIGMITNIINTSQSEMRALLLHLRPINLESKRLKEGIEMLLNELQTKINIELIWNVEDVCLPTNIEDNLFRIIQELLSNTLRHAKANSLEVYLKKIDQTVLLRVVDDGKGFNMEEKKVGSYGLNNMKERASAMGGTCRIVSFIGQGTSIEIKVPIVLGSEMDDKNVID